MSRLSILVMLVGLLGCRGKEDDTGIEGTVVDDDGSLDVDGDGYDSDVDCDDFDAEVNPGVEEECDGIDNE